MKRTKFIVLLLLVNTLIVMAQNQMSGNLQRSLQFLQHPTKDYVFVIAHRGDWRNAPENSFGAMDGCIRLGVNAMETDLAETKDGVLVIMHDETVDRTTNGKGKVKNMTLAELKTLRLKDGLGRKTEYTVPTLKEMLLHAKGKIVLDLDVKSDIDFSKIASLLRETGMEKQVILRSYRPLNEARNYYGNALKDLIYIPGINKSIQNISAYIRDFEKEINPKAFTVVFDDDKSTIAQYMDTVLTKGDAVWVHVITANRSGNHNDDRALIDPEGAYGWLIHRGVRMMQTDRPEMLIGYLKSKGLH